MRPGLLAADLCATAGDLDEAALRALRDAAYAFARAGGRPTLTEWATLSTEERQALGDAAAALRAEEAVHAAAAFLAAPVEPTRPPDVDPLGAALDRAAARAGAMP